MYLIVVQSFLLSSGMLLVLLGCGLYDNWLPLLSLLSCCLAPLPNLVKTHTLAQFVSSFFAVSAIGSYFINPHTN